MFDFVKLLILFFTLEVFNIIEIKRPNILKNTKQIINQIYFTDVIYLQGNKAPILLPCAHATCLSCFYNHRDKPCPKACTSQTENAELEDRKPMLNVYAYGLLKCTLANPKRGKEPEIAFEPSMPKPMTNGLIF